MQPPRSLGTAPIFTPRLELLAIDRAILDACASPELLVRLLSLAQTPAWPPAELDEAALAWFRAACEASPDDAGCLLRLVLLRSPRLLVGSAGFKGPPTREGRMDVGYSVLEEHQRRGYATEAVDALARWAFQDPRVRVLVGETYPHLPASIRVLEKNGFRFSGVGTGFSGERDVSVYTRERA